jgi:hypothetical protein
MTLFISYLSLQESDQIWCDCIKNTELLHAFVDSVGVNRVGGVAGHLACSPAPALVLLLAYKLAVVLVDVLPANLSDVTSLRWGAALSTSRTVLVQSYR